MAEGATQKLFSLTKTFLKVAAIGASIAFGFYIMNPLDFVMFHELAEGQAFMEAAKPAISSFLRGDIPLLGFSIADTFTSLGGLFSGAGAPVGEVADLAMNTAEKALTPDW